MTDDGEAVEKSGLRLRSASDLGRGRDCAKAQGEERETELKKLNSFL